jgi:apolipoprotein N-acyltransferase
LGSAVFERFAHRIILLSGWQRAIAALFAGAVGALALAPLNILPAFIVSITTLVWLIDGCVGGKEGGILRSNKIQLRQAMFVGWWFGFGYFLAGLWWLGAAFLVEADKFAWALPLGVIGLPALMALFPALGCGLAGLLWGDGVVRIFAIATGLGLSEWIRAIVFTGFPWNDFGMILGGNLILGQFGSIVGLHGLTFLSLWLAAAFATWTDFGRGYSETVLKPVRRYHPAGFAVVGIALLAIFGAIRLAANPTEFKENARLRLMQPNLAQDKKFKPEFGAEILANYIKLSDRATSPRSTGISTVTHLFWPESPFPFLLSQNAEALAKIGKFLPRGAVLITGAARSESVPAGKRKEVGTRRRFFNSIQLVEANGIIAQTYDKIHLVPFGEYLPLANLFTRFGLRQFVHIPGGFSPGSATRTLNLPGIGSVAPLICYEAIFPGAVAARYVQGVMPELIVNITNDGWFGVTSGPYQHFAQARLRSIEEGLPMVRVANTGISAILDPVGRIVDSLPIGVSGVIDSRLPKKAEATIYSSFGLYMPAITALLFLIMCFLFRIKRSA